MAFAQNTYCQNNANDFLPDTQEILTEDESQSMYIEPLRFSAPVWAKLLFIPNQKFFIGKLKRKKRNLCRFLFFFPLFLFCIFLAFSDLRFDQAWVGRESPNNENVDRFVINNQICPSKWLDRISKCHFTIDRESSTNEKRADNDLSPAVITCQGRNGIYINDDKLSLGDKQILAHDSVIKLTKKYELFRFTYQNTPAELNTLPKSCLKKYHIGVQIGSGGCGIVRLVHNLSTTKKYAMKVIKKEINPMVRTRVADNAKILNEVNIMKKLSHTHVLSLMDYFETPERVIIIMVMRMHKVVAVYLIKGLEYF